LDPPEEETNELMGVGDDESSFPVQSNMSDVFDHYVSPCEFRVSNDPMLDSDQDVCDTTIYGCVRDHTFLIHAMDDVIQFPVSYDYDVYYKFDSPDYTFMDMVDFLEGSILEHLASLLGLKQCPPAPISNGRNRDGTGNNRNRRLEAFTEEQKAAFIAINSDPADNEATEYGMYKISVELLQVVRRLLHLTVLIEWSRMLDSARRRNGMSGS
jgi:hypothetical protein